MSRLSCRSPPSSLIAVSALPLAAQQQAASRGARGPQRDLEGRAGNKAKTDALTTIQGNALELDQRPADQHASVRLRDARFGRIVDTQVTDKSGLFAFRAIDPGSYIVEIVGQRSVDSGGEPAAQRERRRSGVGGRQAAVPDSAVRRDLLGTRRTPSAAAVATEAAAEQRRRDRADQSGQPQSRRPSMFEPTASGAPRSSTTIRTAICAAADVAAARRSGPAAPPPAPYTPENEVHLLDRLAVLYRYRRLCIDRVHPGDGGDDHPGLQQRQDVPGAGARC